MANKAPSSPTTTATRRFILPSLEAARQFGARLAAALRPGDRIRLEGDLGAGKTELARAVIQARSGHQIEVPSPTFTLVQLYDCQGLALLHADLYRISDPWEVDELGLFDDPEAVCLVEWWGRAETLLPLPGLVIALRQGEGENVRNVCLNALGQGWRDRLALICT